MITREQLVTESVQRHARGALTAHGYLPNDVTMLESFPYGYIGELETNLIATGFDFDNEGSQAELGSDLKVRLYTVSFFCSARPRHGRRTSPARSSSRLTPSRRSRC